jgi:hypothetical protein
VISVAAYRDRCGITSEKPLGDAPTALVQRDDARRVSGLLRNLASVLHEPTRPNGLDRTAEPTIT